MIKIQSSNIDKVIKQLEEYRNGIQEKLQLFMERLADIGVETADIIFKNAQYDGENDVTINDPVWQSENELIVSATGNAVAFIEFGTGVTYTQKHPKAEELGAVRGAYGQGKGKQKSWAYYGMDGTNGKILKNVDGKGDLILTQGNPPAMAMYEAGKQMRGNILKIAKEVFKE